MTTARHLKVIANAGDPDDALPRRCDVVTAAMKVLEAHEEGRRKKLNDFVACAMVDEAVQDLLGKCRRYRAALKRRLPSTRNRP